MLGPHACSRGIPALGRSFSDETLIRGLRVASPIALLVQTANRFSSSIYIESGDKKVNVKSIMGMMSLAMNYEDMVTVVTEGEDEKEALDTLEQFLSEG